MQFLTRKFGVIGRIFLAATIFWTGGQTTGERLPKINPEAARALWEQSSELKLSGDARGALSVLIRLIASNPDNHDYLSRQAQLYHELREFQKEISVWELFMTVAPFPAEACPNLAHAYEGLGLPDKALQAHQRCLALDPSKPDLKFYLAHAYEKRDRRKAAEKLYLEILSNVPTYSDASLGVARIRMSENRYAEADKLVMEVLNRTKGHVDAFLLAALIADRSERREQAKVYIREAISRAPDYAELYRILGHWCRQDKDYDCALRAYTRVCDLEPGNAEDRAKLAEVKGLAP